MNGAHLNEHDANQGAQSAGEFLGMTGNSGWYLLGAGGATILMVIVLWGVLGVSLLLCLFVGVLLCLGAVAYVFTLKNNKPEHYDTDFFESALVEAGVLAFRFGPRLRRPVNPFKDGDCGAEAAATASGARCAAGVQSRGSAPRAVPATPPSVAAGEGRVVAREDPEPVIARVVYEELAEKLTTTEEMLEEALVEGKEG